MARNILVVEDDRNISDLIRMYLEKEGFGVRIAYDGGKAVEEYDAKAPDLVLLDIMLPGVVPELSPIKTFWLGQVKSEQDKRKTPENRMVPGFLGILKSRSALAELRSAAGGLETVLFALLHAGVAGEVTGSLELSPVVLIQLEQGAGYTVC